MEKLELRSTYEKETKNTVRFGEELGVKLTVHADKLRYEPASIVPPDLLADLRAHKKEIMAILTKPKAVDGPPRWHAETIAAAVRKEGICLFWNELFGEMIAFIADDSFRDKVPAGIVVYTDHELRELFGEDKKALSPESFRLIHEAKRASGGHVTSYEGKGGS